MSADISARTFRPAEQFAAVVVGQGQVLVDSALNEQEEIARHRVTLTTDDVVGPSGVPKQTGGFEVSVAPDGHDLLVSPGRIYVDGILCVNEPQVVEAAIVSPTVLTAGIAAPDGVAFAGAQWIDVVTPSGSQRVQIATAAGRTLTLASTPAGLPAAGGIVTLQRVTSLRAQPSRFSFDPFDPNDPEHLLKGAYRIDLDVRYRDISSVEDPSIREVALGDADAAARLKVVWQLRVTRSGAVGGGTCTPDPAPAPGLLAASTVPGLPSDDPCELPDEAGYRGLENQLYRVEVHNASATEVVLKWQRDNASTASRVVSLGATLQVEDMGRDDERGFVSAKFVEVTDDFLELEQRPSDLSGVDTPDKATRTIKLLVAPAVARMERRARARRWDGVVTIPLTQPTAGDPQVLERGVQVALTPGSLRPGDYWLIPARTANSAGGGTIEWPTDDDANPLALAPDGIRHHVTGLALVDTDATQFLTTPGALRDCRHLFPSLTTIAATDVSVDPTPCGFTGVTNVQEAIDALCDRRGDLCTFTATPGPGWESVFDGVANGTDAQICFPVGSYPTTKPVTVANKGHLVLQGAGPGSVLTTSASETLVSFQACSSVRVQSLSVGSTAPSGSAGGLGGVLSFTGCGMVTVTECRIQTAGKLDRESTCVRIDGGIARVEHNLLQVGDRQIGVLIVNAGTSTVTSNQLVATGAPAAGNGPATRLERQQARRLLISDLSTAPAGGSRIGVKIANSAMSFHTTPAGAAWSGLLQPQYDTMKHFQKAIDKVMRAVFAGHPLPAAANLVAFINDRILSRRVTVMSQGIVVAGSTVGDIVIESNSMDATIQGIHIGASSRLQARSGPAEQVGAVTVVRNKLHVLVPPEGARARHAIFIGNADRVRVLDNDVSFENRAEGDFITTDGIRIFGFIGRFMTVRDNVVDSFPGGISLHLFMPHGGGQQTAARMWAVEDNLMIGALAPVTLDGPLKAQVKFRGNRPGPADN